MASHNCINFLFKTTAFSAIGFLNHHLRTTALNTYCRLYGFNYYSFYQGILQQINILISTSSNLITSNRIKSMEIVLIPIKNQI
jgi:hypothetical protein